MKELTRIIGTLTSVDRGVRDNKNFLVADFEVDQANIDFQKSLKADFRPATNN